MVAFQGAVDLGYRYIETDVHLSGDGRVVIFHDDHLDRLTDGAGKVWEWDWQHLQHLDAAEDDDQDRRPGRVEEELVLDPYTGRGYQQVTVSSRFQVPGLP